MVAENPNHPIPPCPGRRCAVCIGGGADSEEPNLGDSTVREAVRLASCFTKAIQLTEELARGGRAGLVRIPEMQPVLQAMRDYLARLPAGKVER